MRGFLALMMLFCGEGLEGFPGLRRVGEGSVGFGEGSVGFGEEGGFAGWDEACQRQHQHRVIITLLGPRYICVAGNHAYECRLRFDKVLMHAIQCQWWLRLCCRRSFQQPRQRLGRTT